MEEGYVNILKSKYYIVTNTRHQISIEGRTKNKNPLKY